MNDATPIRAHLASARRVSGGTALPPGCPVTPLGGNGQVFHYINAIGQFVAVGAQQHSKNILLALFATKHEWLIQHFPRTFDKETGKPTDFTVNAVTAALMRFISACRSMTRCAVTCRAGALTVRWMWLPCRAASGCRPSTTWATRAVRSTSCSAERDRRSSSCRTCAACCAAAGSVPDGVLG